MAAWPPMASSIQVSHDSLEIFHSSSTKVCPPSLLQPTCSVPAVCQLHVEGFPVQPSTAPTLKSHQQGEDQLLGSMGPLPLHRKSAQAFGSLEIGDDLLDLCCLMCLLDTTALLCLPLHKPGDDAWSAPGCFAGAVDFIPKLFAW